MDPAPWSTERDKFLALLVASRLLSVGEVIAVLSDCDKSADVSQLCERLIAQDLLSEWQCNKLREGKYKGFFMGQYKILDQLSVSLQHYLVEDLSTQRKVTVCVQRNDNLPDGMDFRVVD